MMRIQSMLAAAAIACGGMMFVSQARGADPAPPTVQPAAPSDTFTRTEVKTVAVAPAPDADDIRKTIAAATENAVSKNGFDNLVAKFVDADRDRIKKFKPADNFSTLDGRIDQFRKDWKAKYNQDFGFERQRNDVLNDMFAKVTQGEIGEARTASGKVPSAEPSNVKGGAPEDLKKSGVNQPDANSSKVGGGETNREPGRNIATFTITGMMSDAKAGNLPKDAAQAADKMHADLPIPLIHELPDTWKIDLPDNIDGQKLYDNVLKHLTMVDEDRANWPADVNEAYRSVTRHMMAAVMEGGKY